MRALDIVPGYAADMERTGGFRSEELEGPDVPWGRSSARPGKPSRDVDDLTLFFDVSLDLFCIAGLDGYLKRLNPAWTATLGWSLDELRARPFLDFVHPDDRQATAVEVERLAGGAETSLFENRYRRKDGSFRWLQWSARSLARGRGICASARDVTRSRRLEREVLEIADREKERLGRELHDGLCQSLAGIAALSSTLSRKLMAGADPGASAAAAEITALLNDTIGQARSLARGLGPVGLEEVGLAGALETLSLNVGHLFGVRCTFERDHLLPRSPPGVDEQLLRIAQEAVNNAVAHGRAGLVEISLRARGGTGVLAILDDGVGLPDGALERKGIGMRTMAYRSRLVGGSLSVKRRNGQGGTSVRCAFPLPDPRGKTQTARR